MADEYPRTDNKNEAGEFLTDAGEWTGGAAKDAWDWISGAGKNNFNASWLQPGQANLSTPNSDLAGSRYNQWAAMQQMGNWAQGNGPSAAQAQLNAARDQNIAQAMSMAKSMPGATPGAQQWIAAEGAANASQDAANQAAQLRAKEQQAAMQMYMQSVGDYRQGDVDTYKAMAQAYADSQRANAQVAAENAAAKRGLIGGIIEGVTGGIL